MNSLSSFSIGDHFFMLCVFCGRIRRPHSPPPNVHIMHTHTQDPGGVAGRPSGTPTLRNPPACGSQCALLNVNMIIFRTNSRNEPWVTFTRVPPRAYLRMQNRAFSRETFYLLLPFPDSLMGQTTLGTRVIGNAMSDISHYSLLTLRYMKTISQFAIGC